MRRRVTGFILCFLLLLSTVLFALTAFADTYDIVKIRLSVGNTNALPFFVDGNYTVAEDATVKLPRQLYTVKLEADNQLHLYYGTELKYAGPTITLVQHTPTEGLNNFIYMDNEEHGHCGYLGNMVFSIDGSYIRATNHVYLEEYLYGVVPYEMSDSWPLEALKAQAVAARTYAVRYIDGDPYHMVDTTDNQVYKGFNASYINAQAAVDGTSKQVLTLDGAFVPTYYSASNGGQVDIAQHRWSASNPIMPYQIIKDDPYDTQNAWSRQEVLIFPKASADVDYQYMSGGAMVQGGGTEEANAKKYFQISSLPSVAAKGYIASVSSDVQIVGVNSITAHTHQGNHGLVNDFTGANPCRCFEKADVNMSVLAYRYATADESTAPMLGDCNADNRISITDYTLIRLDILGLKALSDTAKAAADINQDGKISITDYTLVRLDILGLKEIPNVTSAGELVQEQVTVDFTIDLHEFDDSDGLYRAFNEPLGLFVVEETDTSWNIYQRRYGHGIGMSQRGAQQRANSGDESVRYYNQILDFYYPNTALTTLSITPPVLTDIPEAPEDNSNAAVNCSSSMNVRSQPNTSCTVLGRLPNDARVQVTQEFVTAEWHKINYGGQDAYLHKDYVELDS